MKNDLKLPFEITDKVAEEFMTSMEGFRKLLSYYQSAILEIETKFRVLNNQFTAENNYNPIESIKSRVKSPESILEKLQRKNKEISIKSVEENLDDVAGVRVICSFIDDIYMLAECLLEQDDVKLIEMKDYIKNPKENGYRSLHLIVEIPIFLKKEKRPMRVEVQLRTIAMDFWASLEHKLRYKKNIDCEIADMLSVELKDCAEKSAQLDVRMENVKNTIVKN